MRPPYIFFALTLKVWRALSFHLNYFQFSIIKPLLTLLQVRFPVPGIPHSGDHLLRDDHSPLLLSPLCRGKKFTEFEVRNKKNVQGLI
jgi:hypothetical protein